MTSQTPTPKGLALALVLTGVAVALAGSVAALATGNRALMGIASVGFAMQFAGWVLNGRRNGGAR
ncbi:hypothetical protein [Streptomyces halobius]|uniref:Secreted protein with PEP-CTERM sorting signal n=1 Tax=Streptomyces halobius TaxID=2879846 RepID=A0ABY4M5S2_9ACTN|nr:hypothetical protein [Streptomyces halobius]UQA93111.1 hypothetical protein K9S39_15790 [Streptomyces halobius]